MNFFSRFFSRSSPLPPQPMAMPIMLAGDTRGQPVSEKAIELIAKWEGFRAAAYLCPAGVWTIGYGTTRYEGGEPVREGDTMIEAGAKALLRKQAAQFARDVDVSCKVPISVGERGALVSLAYNIGITAFRNSTLLRLLNAGRRSEAAAQFDVWNKAGGKVLPGLVARRAQERLMFGTSA